MTWTIYSLAGFVIGALTIAGVAAWLFAVHYDKKHQESSNGDP